MIPTRDRWSLLQRTLVGALGQEEVDHEVIVVDDGSQDATAERLALREDSRLRVVRREPSRGVAAARNAGIAAASASWVAFLDDDDLWSPRKLRAQLDAVRLRDASFAYTTMVTVDEDADPIGLLLAPEPDALTGTLRRNNAIGSPSSVLVKTALVRAVGGFDESFAVLADWDLWLRIVEHGRVAACPEPLVAYTQHATNMHHALSSAVVHAEFARLATKHAGRDRSAGFDEEFFLRWAAGSQHLAGRRLGAARGYLRVARRSRQPLDVARAVAAALGRRARLRPAPPAPEWLAAYRG